MNELCQKLMTYVARSFHYEDFQIKAKKEKKGGKKSYNEVNPSSLLDIRMFYIFTNKSTTGATLEDSSDGKKKKKKRGKGTFMKG